MSLATVILSTLLAATLVLSAARKVSGRPEVVATYVRVGVSEERLKLLAIILVVGALGLIGGFVWPPVGVAASAALVLYFLLAIIAHLVNGDARNVPTPVVIEALSVAALILWIGSL